MVLLVSIADQYGVLILYIHLNKSKYMQNFLDNCLNTSEANHQPSNSQLSIEANRPSAE
jgi:hypothetical protein